MNVIYEPRGRAREYAELACNLYMGCTHGCKYCYAPGCMRTTAKEWHKQGAARNGVIDAFKKDAKTLSGDMRRVLFCFLSDPYQPLERDMRLTRQAVEIAYANQIKVDILTKGDAGLITEDLPLMKKADVRLGITLSFANDDSRKKWEPRASTVEQRFALLERAHRKGVFTWVSMEPVICPDEALEVIRKAYMHVDFWKIGKLNHNKEVESKIDWEKFLSDVRQFFRTRRTANFLIKKDLEAFSR